MLPQQACQAWQVVVAKRFVCMCVSGVCVCVSGVGGVGVWGGVDGLCPPGA